MFTEIMENTSQILGNFIPLDRGNSLIDPLFHRELALNSEPLTTLDLDRFTDVAKVESQPNDHYDSLIGVPQTSSISGLLPDLVIESISGVTSASLGQYLNFSYNINNKGNAAASTSVTRFYLSQDTLLDNTDSYLGMDSVTSLDAKISRTESASIYLNNNISAGTYNLLALADGYNYVSEANETNNITTQILQVTSTPQPDLVIKSLSIPAQLAIASSLNFSYSIQNIGNNNADASISKFYLSSNLTLDSSDLYLAADSVNTIEAGVTKVETANIYLNDSLEIGTYYLLAQADSLASVTESNENNNLFYQTLELTHAPKPDLLISSFSLQTTDVSDNTLNFSYTVKNAGNRQAGTNSTKFYISNNTTLDQSDIYINSEFVTDIEALSTRNRSMSLQLSNNLNSGTYYLFAVSDADNCIIESDETNNISYQTITITNPNSVYSSSTGYGLVNASAALAKVLGNNVSDVPNLGGKEWDSDLMNVPEVWAKGYTGKNIIVAVLDTGVARFHPDLKKNIWSNKNEIVNNGIDDDGNGYIDDDYGWNFINQTNNTLDIHGHGTHIAGTIAGVKNQIGVTGVAYNSQIMPVKVLDNQGNGNWTSIANGIRYAVDNGARVINISLGGFAGSSELQNAIQYASNHNAVVVMAAGNSGASTPQYPAAYAQNWGLAVGSIDKYKNFASWSNRAGNNANMAYLTAPGTDIYSTLPNKQYGSLSGTSMAASQISGVVALLLSADNSLTDSQIRQILTSTSGNNNLSNQTSTQSTLSQTTSTYIKEINLSETLKISTLKQETLISENLDLLTTNTIQQRYRQSTEMTLCELNFMSALI
ncbi:hypothetical protein C7H19_04790 [Aphanothece hegewaldii CCALA 016]|uniref:Subtilisin n=1 Tax=Aphanothece hegewaldii CCALA 016 TaxID=2107694 RepID=A0A2T1M0W7_9CHRO|nr:S8 family serine peptidase [Aphanothece hegewaldii]PSF38315.1 hypothetical protein C7H19_04790 [Aphanothece hegewaldii CCALA 016]